MLARLGERDRGAAAAGAAGAADAVDVRLGGGRHVVVDDVREVLDVEAARGDVGGDEQVGLAVAEAAHHAVALPLLHAAVQRLGAVAVRVERLDERLDLEPRAAEHERRRRVLHVEDALERRRLVRARHDVGDLADARQLAGGRLLARDRHARRILQVALGDRQDPRRHRRREERRLPRPSGVASRIASRSSAKPMSSISSASSRTSTSQPIELERAAPDVIERAAGRGDDDVGAALERADLLVHRRAAVERQHGRAGRRARTCESLRRPASPARASARARGRGAAPVVGAARRDPLQHRQRERRRLARAGCRLRRAGRAPRAAAESSRAEPASALRSRAT